MKPGDVVQFVILNRQGNLMSFPTEKAARAELRFMAGTIHPLILGEALPKDMAGQQEASQ